MANFNVGVIGIGYWGKKILDEFSKIESVSVIGVSDLDDNNLAFASEKYGVKAGYRDYKELLALKDLHAVAVCTPNQVHFSTCKDALDGGKHAGNF